jgi:hypothetical protein
LTRPSSVSSASDWYEEMLHLYSFLSKLCHNFSISQGIDMH